MRLLFGPGQRHDVTRSNELLDNLKPGAVIAGKGYGDHEEVCGVSDGVGAGAIWLAGISTFEVARTRR